MIIILIYFNHKHLNLLSFSRWRARKHGIVIITIIISANVGRAFILCTAPC